MRVTLTMRHSEIPQALRERALAVVTRVSRLAGRPVSAQVTFGLERQRATAELRLHASRGAVHVASAAAADHRTALDRAAAKLRRQLDKARVRRHRRPSPP